MARKIANKNSPGDATHFAADDWDYVNKYLTGVDQVAVAPPGPDPVTIATNTTYWDNRLKLYNPARTFSYSIRSLAILANYDLTLPLLTSNDEIVGLLVPQSFENKTFNINLNTLKHSTTNALGDILANNGTKFDRVPLGTTGGHVLKVKGDLSGVEWAAESVAGGGETNTAANLGTAGVGVYHSKSGVQLRFKKINAATNGRITVTDDITNNEIDLAITPGTEGQFLKTAGGVPVWSSLTSQYGVVMPDGSNFPGHRYGRFIGGARDGDNLFGGLQIHGNNIGATVETGWTYTNFTTEAADDAIAGFQTHWITCRQHNPTIRMSFKHTLSTEKGWAGLLSSATYPTGGGGDNPLANRHGVMFGYADIDTNWLIRWNDGSAVPQTFNTGVPKDTNLQKVRFILNHTGTPSVTVKLGDADTTVVNANTVQIPAALTALAIYNIVESVGGTTMELRTDYAYMTEAP